MEQTVCVCVCAFPCSLSLFLSIHEIIKHLFFPKDRWALLLHTWWLIRGSLSGLQRGRRSRETRQLLIYFDRSPANISYTVFICRSFLSLDLEVGYLTQIQCWISRFRYPGQELDHSASKSKNNLLTVIILCILHTGEIFQIILSTENKKNKEDKLTFLISLNTLVQWIWKVQSSRERSHTHCFFVKVQLYKVFYSTLQWICLYFMSVGFICIFLSAHKLLFATF